MDDFTVSVRQIGQYPKVIPAPGTQLLGQLGGIGGAYVAIDVGDLFTAALTSTVPVVVNGTLSCADLFMRPTGLIGWGADAHNQALYPVAMTGTLAFTPNDGWRFNYANLEVATTLAHLNPAGVLDLPNGTVSVARGPILDNEVATKLWTELNTVASFNGRVGPVCLQSGDMSAALCLQNGDSVASQSWVNETICNSWQEWYTVTPLVFSFMGRVGDICLTDADVSFACNQPGALARTNTPPPGDVSTRIANCAFVSGAVDDLYQQITDDIGNAVTGNYAPINSPAFTGIPTAPTANPGSNTGQLATTAFVQAAIVASTTGVSSFNTRTGAIILEATDVSEAGGALLVSPAFTGVPTAPTAIAGNNSQQLATTAFVANALAGATAGVTSFNTRTGAVVLSTADITGAGGAPLNSPGLTGVPTAPTAAPATNTAQLATTAFVTAAISAATGVASWNGRTGAVQLQWNDVSAVGGAPIASPALTGNPTAPTQNPGTSNTTLATTAFVQAALTGSLGVASFNGRTGAVTLSVTDITGAGGAPAASPALTGVPTAPTAVTTSSDTTIATTAFVKAAISSSALVSSFNSRTGAVTLTAADVSAAGGALIASPTFTGTPAAPTAIAGTSTTQLATTAFVANALSTAGGVISFNGRAGAVSLTAADVAAVGAVMVISKQMFTTTGTYTPHAGLLYAVVEIVGGGGGGGTAAVATGNSFAGGGGGSGGYSRSVLTAAQVGASQTVTIGAGGAAGGGNGAATTFGSLVLANGGIGGQSNSGVGGSLGFGGAGGAMGTGDLAVPGDPGDTGWTVASPISLSHGGNGGSMWGGGGLGGGATGGATPGSPGTIGGGGGGGVSNNSATGNGSGGTGGAGWCLVTEYSS